MRPLPGRTPTPGVGIGEHRPLRRDQEIATECQFQPARERRAVDGPDDRLADRRDLVDGVRRVKTAEERFAFSCCLFEIDPGAKGRIGTGEHDCGHGLVAVDRHRARRRGHG